jgi:hypothetical protein
MPQEKTISSLTPDERLALVALAERVVLTDRAADDDEVEALEQLVEQIGKDEYATLVAKADAAFEADEAFEVFLETITDQDARELILGTVVGLALSEGVLSGEADWIEWVSKTWNVSVRVDPAEPQE